MALIVAIAVFVVLWAALFFVALLVDEDVNHWNWPGDGGPGARATALMATWTGAISGVVAALLWWLVAGR